MKLHKNIAFWRLLGILMFIALVGFIVYNIIYIENVNEKFKYVIIGLLSLILLIGYKIQTMDDH